MAETSIIPLLRERKIQILRSLSPYVTNPDIYLADPLVWVNLILSKEIKCTIETLDEDNHGRVMFAMSRLLDMIAAQDYKDRLNIFIGCHWLVISLSVIPGDVSRYERVFSVDPEVAQKLKALNDGLDSVEWVRIL